MIFAILVCADLYMRKRKQLSFNGAIDEVKIYNRALSANEIKAEYDAGNPVQLFINLKTAKDSYAAGEWVELAE